jgi:hypothetical protein
LVYSSSQIAAEGRCSDEHDRARLRSQSREERGLLPLSLTIHNIDTLMGNGAGGENIEVLPFVLSPSTSLVQPVEACGERSRTIREWGVGATGLEACFGLLRGVRAPSSSYHPVLPRRRHQLAWLRITHHDVRAPGTLRSAFTATCTVAYTRCQGGLCNGLPISVPL